MGLITGLLTLPLAPVRGVVWVGEQIRQQAEREWSDPAAIQAALADVAAMRESGELDAEQAEMLEEELVQRLMHSG